MRKPAEDKNVRRAETLRRLVEAAATGARCPQTDEGLPSEDVSALAREGKILVEISTKNWRRVTILFGEHKGKATAPNPLPHARVYLTIDTNGSLRNGTPMPSRRPITLAKVNLPEPV
jgi:hypothetical protein